MEHLSASAPPSISGAASVALPRPSLLAIFAHPDDEALAVGGTLARYAAEGVDVRLVCATRGEAGSPGEPARCPRELVGAWRSLELRRSCRALGVAKPVFLGARDGWLSADRAALVGPLVAAIRRFRPQVVLTWGPDGLTGHPDHVAVHHATTVAFAAAGDPLAFPELADRGLQPHWPARLYSCALPASLVTSLDSRLPGELDGRPLGLAGVDDEAISAALDIGRYAGRKLCALTCHETQQHDLFRLSASDLVRLCAREYFVLTAGTAAPWRVDDLFAGLLPALAPTAPELGHGEAVALPARP